MKNNAHNASTTNKKANKDLNAKVDKLEQKQSRIEEENKLLSQENYELK